MNFHSPPSRPLWRAVWWSPSPSFVLFHAYGNVYICRPAITTNRACCQLLRILFPSSFLFIFLTRTKTNFPLFSSQEAQIPNSSEYQIKWWYFLIKFSPWNLCSLSLEIKMRTRYFSPDGFRTDGIEQFIEGDKLKPGPSISSSCSPRHFFRHYVRPVNEWKRWSYRRVHSLIV